MRKENKVAILLSHLHYSKQLLSITGKCSTLTDACGGVFIALVCTLSNFSFIKMLLLTSCLLSLMSVTLSRIGVGPTKILFIAFCCFLGWPTKAIASQLTVCISLASKCCFCIYTCFNCMTDRKSLRLARYVIHHCAFKQILFFFNRVKRCMKINHKHQGRQAELGLQRVSLKENWHFLSASMNNCFC